jgi:hypothetical protein
LLRTIDPLAKLQINKSSSTELAEAARQRARGDEPGKPKRNRGHLPAHLPRVERVIEPESTLCPCGCGCGEMAKIGEDVSERLDVIPAQFRVLVTRRPKYACRRCSQAVAQALEGATGVFGEAAKGAPEPVIDVKTLHAKTAGLALENDFLSGALGKAGLLPSARK